MPRKRPAVAVGRVDWRAGTPGTGASQTGKKCPYEFGLLPVADEAFCRGSDSVLGLGPGGVRVARLSAGMPPVMRIGFRAEGRRSKSLSGHFRPDYKVFEA
jgi:hypothetical protein